MTNRNASTPTDTVTGGPETWWARGRSLSTVAPLLLDVVLPVGVYFLLHTVGASDVVALGAGAVVPGLTILATLLRRRTLDRLGCFVLVMFALGAALVLVTGDARFVLAKQAAFVLVAGLACLISLRRRPAVLSIAKPMATNGSRQLELLWEQSWTGSAPFQRAVRASTLAFGLALIVDAVGRVAIVYTLPVSEAVLVANAPGLVAVVGALVFHLRHTKPVFENIKHAASA